MLPAFAYFSPSSKEEAIKFLAEKGKDTKILAGGTDLVLNLRNGGIRPRYVLDLGSITNLRYIEEKGERICLGSLTTHTDLAQSPLISQYGRVLAKAASVVGSPQIRNLGTVGGNIVNASPAADTIPALVALGAKLKIESLKGERIIPLEEFFERPYRTKIKPYELLSEISFLKLPSSASSSFIKLARRQALAIARINVAVVIIKDSDSRILEIRIAPGSVTPTPGRIPPAEVILKGEKAREELIKKAAQQVSAEMVKQSGIRPSTEYKKPVVEVLVERAIKEALASNS